MRCLRWEVIIRGSHSGQIRMRLEVHLPRRIIISHQEGRLLEVSSECNLEVCRESSPEACRESSQEVCNVYSRVECRGSSLEESSECSQEVESSEFNLVVV